jgi:hypothetical protein
MIWIKCGKVVNKKREDGDWNVSDKGEVSVVRDQSSLSSFSFSLSPSHCSPHRLSDRHLAQCAHSGEAEGGLGGREEELEHCVWYSTMGEGFEMRMWFGVVCVRGSDR